MTWDGEGAENKVAERAEAHPAASPTSPSSGNCWSLLPGSPSAAFSGH